MPKEKAFFFVYFIRMETGCRCGGTLPFSLSRLRISLQGNSPALAGTFKLPQIVVVAVRLQNIY
jgi:hypothetical protein